MKNGLRFLICFLSLMLGITGVAFASGDDELDASGDIASGEVIEENNYDASYNYEDYNFEYKRLKGTVIDAGEVYEEDNGYDTYKYQKVKVLIKDQGYTTTKEIIHSVSYYSGIQITKTPLKVGDKVYVYTIFENGKITNTAIDSRNNNGYIVAIILIYAGAIILIGGLKGLKALISLILTILAVFYIILPQILDGSNPMLVTILTSILITLVTLVIVAGFNKKAIAAIVGTSGGIIVAGIFAVIFGNLMDLTGVNEEVGEMVGAVSQIGAYDFKGILFSGIIIGALGACMDVSMSISSALHELICENPNLSFRKMMRAGMNIGKDMMGTMTNTLILAYTGGAIITIMIFMTMDMQLYEVLNKESILEEVLRAIAGSFGIVTTIPITTAISSAIMAKKS